MIFDKDMDRRDSIYDRIGFVGLYRVVRGSIPWYSCTEHYMGIYKGLLEEATNLNDLMAEHTRHNLLDKRFGKGRPRFMKVSKILAERYNIEIR